MASNPFAAALAEMDAEPAPAPTPKTPKSDAPAASNPFAAALAEMDAPAADPSRPEWLTPGPRKTGQRLTDEADVPAGKFRTRDGRLVDNPIADEVSADIAAGKQQAEQAFERATTPQKGEGFFTRAGKSITHGAGALATVGGDVAATKGAALLDPAKRRQALRGLDDVMTLGYGQRLAARAGNALGDAPDVALGPETFGITNAKADSFADAFVRAGGDRADAGLGDRTAAMLAKAVLGGHGGEPVANTQEADQAAAPAYRAATQLVGSFAPGSAVGLAGKAGGKFIGSPLAGLIPGAGVLPSVLRGATAGLGGHVATAPVTAALSAGAEGQRFEAAKEAVSDPLSILMAGAGGAAGETFQAKTLNSKGAKARALIEAEGQGAKVTPLSSGKGGVFKDDLAGLTPDDRGIGAAAKRGASRIADTIEQQFKDKNDFDYREAPKEIKAAASETKEAAKAARRAARAAEIAYREDIAAVKDAVKTETADRARQILDNIENEHRVEVSKPYRALKNEIDSSPAAARMRDVTPIVESMQQAINDLETAPHVRAALEQQVKILENYRTKAGGPAADDGVPGFIEGEPGTTRIPRQPMSEMVGGDGARAHSAGARAPVDDAVPGFIEGEPGTMRLPRETMGDVVHGSTGAASGDLDGPIMLPERQLNGLRRTLMRAAKVGGSDAPGEAEAPLRRAAFVAKEMVDAGPYKALNDLYATGSAKREAARKAVGLPGKPSKSAAADEKRLTSNLRKAIDDPTALPGKTEAKPLTHGEASKMEQHKAAAKLAELPKDEFRAEVEANGIALPMYRGHKGGDDSGVWWFASRPKTAAGYAKVDGIVKQADVTMRRPYVATTTEMINMGQSTIDGLKSAGYDGVVSQWSGGIPIKANPSPQREVWAVVFDNGKARAGARLPPEADIAAVRAALKAPKAKRDAEMAKISAQIAAAEKRQAATAKKVQEAVKAVEADRALLGLNTKIGTRKTDVNQIRLALQRQGENTGTAGGSAGDAPGLAEFVAKHPETKTASLLPELQRAKADLSFRLTPEHGGLMNRGVGGMVGTAATLAGLLAAPKVAIPYLAALNKTAISGRLLTPLARRTDAAGIGARIGAIQGAGPSGDDIALAREIQRLVREGVPIEIAVARARAEAAARNAPGEVLPTEGAAPGPEAAEPPVAPPAAPADEDDDPPARRRRVSRDDLDDEDDGADIAL